MAPWNIALIKSKHLIILVSGVKKIHVDKHFSVTLIIARSDISHIDVCLVHFFVLNSIDFLEPRNENMDIMHTNFLPNI